MNFIKNIIYFILSIQNKILTNRLNKTLGVKNTSKRKKIYGNGVLLSLESLAEADRNNLEEEITLLLKNLKYDSSEALNYIQKQGTNVYYINNSKYMDAINENLGFIYPQKGFKALYINILTTKQWKFNTDEMFILTKGKLNTYYFLYHFYNWYMFKHGISGIDSDTQAMLNKYLYCAKEEDIAKLQLADIYKLKDAIKQDKSAIEFVFKLCQQFEGAKNALNKMHNGGANI